LLATQPGTHSLFQAGRRSYCRTCSLRCSALCYTCHMGHHLRVRQRAAQAGRRQRQGTACCQRTVAASDSSCFDSNERGMSSNIFTCMRLAECLIQAAESTPMPPCELLQPIPHAQPLAVCACSPRLTCPWQAAAVAVTLAAALPCGQVALAAHATRRRGCPTAATDDHVSTVPASPGGSSCSEHLHATGR